MAWLDSSVEQEKGRGMENARKRRFGDRKEGRRLRTLDPYNELAPFLMKTRNDASNLFIDSVEITEAERFLREKRKNGYPGMGLLHLIIAAYIRTAAQYPVINRFISGQRLYSRHNVEFVMTIKKEMRALASETSVKVAFDRTATISDVYDKLKREIDKVRREGEDTTTDDVAKFFMKLPRLVLKLAVRIIEILDYFGKMPNAIMEASPFHGSVVITDIGSLGLPALYHHLYNFGNVPVFIALGAKRKACELRPDGTVQEKKYMDYTLVMDERCSDGFYFSQAFRLFKSLLRDPRTLDEPIESVMEDID